MRRDNSGGEISEFLDREGSEFNLITVQASYRMSALNRGLLPTGGRSQSISFDMTIPGSELEFYRINYNGQIFFSLFDPFVLRLRTDLDMGAPTGTQRLSRSTNIFLLAVWGQLGI